MPHLAHMCFGVVVALLFMAATLCMVRWLCAVLCCAVLCCAVLCCAVLCVLCVLRAVCCAVLRA